MAYYLSEIPRKIVYYYWLVKLFFARKKNRSRFSVIIPAYQRAHIIERALKSIYSQKFIQPEDIEIIVINDGSTDNIEHILKEHPSVVFLNETHSGVIGQVRNKGLLSAKNEFIAYLDSDDYWLPIHLALHEYTYRKNPELAFISTRATCEHLDFSSGTCKVIRKLNPPFKSYPVTNAVTHKRECFLKLGGFDDTLFGEDQIFWNKIKSDYPHKHLKVKTTIYTFTKNGNNITYSFHPDSEIK